MNEKVFESPISDGGFKHLEKLYPLIEEEQKNEKMERKR